MTEKLNLDKLTGSAKQVEWAKNVIERAYEAVIDGYAEIAMRDDLAPKFISAAEIVADNIRTKLEENTSASSIIDRRGIITYSVISNLFVKEVTKIASEI